MRVLTVCTANVCRSVMAAALLQRHLDAAGVEAVVRSAGTRAGVVATDRDTHRVLDEIGLCTGLHEPRRVTRELVLSDGADLVVTATAEHLREVAVLAPGLFRRTFTAKELARRVLATPPPPDPGRGLDAWLDALGAGRTPRDLLDDRLEDDLVDPYGRGLAAHRATRDELDGLMGVIASSLARWR